ALSVALAPQANLLSAQAEPASHPIWQKLAGVSASKPVNAGAAAVARKSTAVVTSRASSTAGVVSSAASGHALLFMKNKESGASAANSAPAAALTIHPSLPLDVDQSASTVASTSEQPTLVAMNDSPTTDASSSKAEKAEKAEAPQLIAQLAPDTILAQGDAGTTATPIPPVVTGQVDLEEFKPSNIIDLKVSQSRT